MARSPYTLDGAREILSGPDGKWLKALDTLLGVGILVTGPFGLAAWGWVDQKNELIKTLGEVAAAGRARLKGKRVPDRSDVLAATHTALAYGAFFAAFREIVGPVCEKVGLTEDDKRRLTGDAQPDLAKDGLQRSLMNAPIELPWAGCGFRANRDEVIKPLFQNLALHCVAFLQNFEVWHRIDSVRATDPLVRDVVSRAVRRYEAEYKSLAAVVPEFGIWAALGESDATQSAVKRSSEALSRLEELVRSLPRDAEGARNRTREVNAAVNRAVLLEPLVVTDSADDLAQLRIPTVQEGYLTPAFRSVVMDEKCRPADDNWWESAEWGSDLDTFLAAYFSSPRSHQRPLVVLGLPGAGKSMFTKVCAARLSGGDAYAVARVPLRQVSDPTAPIHQQVSGVLDKTTNGRVSWTELSESAVDATRVLLIDGLDEFMQASGNSESNYLHNVVEFQRVERISGHPVSVVVTSRTLVADLARIPIGSLVIKLENFRPEQVRTCLGIWDQVNLERQSCIPSADTILSYGEIAQQPLLLLLLILYGATNHLPAVGENSTPAQIYGDILRRFIQRELQKVPDLDPADLREEQVRAELWRLGIAAFGMFNRGRHYVEEHLLQADLDALDQPMRQRRMQRRGAALTAARQLLGKFFFIHAAEADEGFEGRSYEFLHATFSEYLIARLTLDELTDLWESVDRPSSQNWDDDRLYALLSHQLLSIGGAAILPFVAQLHGALPGSAGQGIRQILRTLLRQAEGRWESGRFAAYSPSGESSLQRFALYTANLIMLVLGVEDRAVKIDSIAPSDVDPIEWWSKMVHIWQGCVPDLDLSEIKPVFSETAIMRSSENDPAQPLVHKHSLMFQSTAASIINAGFGVAGNRFAIDSDDLDVAFAGSAARALTESAHVSTATAAAIEIIRGLKNSESRVLRPSLLMEYVARNPEGFTGADIRSLLDAASVRDRVHDDSWPYSLLLGQYLYLVSDRELSDHLRNSCADSTFVAPLIAGMLVWDDELTQVRKIFDRFPPELRLRVEKCVAEFYPLRQSMDGRRLVLWTSERLLPILMEGDHLVSIWERLGMPLRYVRRSTEGEE
ncbi:hypothetical protein O7602_16935 [Micromonospora sp. WMMD1128]|uniref:NACHT domain-containing protein n=1 Tax=Micromonospora sp. WMMD1128 TaxID=3015150 RepID=UPI00248CDDCF|nr:hypothetical protein [Micromonospora sp. WMMD1128]WBB71445.1 hypothetical protein O7602_16935 [Micromonospora sp. WMMD1128]